MLVEEAERSFREQCRGIFVVVGEAVVGEQVSIAGIQEQLRALDCLHDLAGGGEVFVDPLVVLHHVDLERDALRPRAAELLGREGGAEQQGSLRARPRLGQHLRGHHPEREPGIDQAVGQGLSGKATALEDRVEAGFLGVANALVEVGEGLALVQIWSVHDVSGGAEPIGEGEDPRRQALGVMKEQNLGHGRAA